MLQCVVCDVQIVFQDSQVVLLHYYRLYFKSSSRLETEKERLLLCYQVNEEIVHARFPISHELAVELAALMAQVCIHACLLLRLISLTESVLAFVYTCKHRHHINIVSWFVCVNDVSNGCLCWFQIEMGDLRGMSEGRPSSPRPCSPGPTSPHPTSPQPSSPTGETPHRVTADPALQLVPQVTERFLPPRYWEDDSPQDIRCVALLGWRDVTMYLGRR